MCVCVPLNEFFSNCHFYIHFARCVYAPSQIQRVLRSYLAKAVGPEISADIVPDLSQRP